MAVPSRRTTLGPMNFLDESSMSLGISKESRASFGGALQATRARAPPTTGKKEAAHSSRLSMLGAGDLGRTSLFGRLTTTRGDRADPRAINSKTFQTEAITNLVEFCKATNIRHPISAKILANPTGKDFANIMVHLCQQLDPSFAITGKVEDDVTTLLKSLRYPFVPSKTSLATVGSPQAYPSVLACMSWLVELLSYEALARQQEEEDIERALAAGPQISTQANASPGIFFFTYVSEAYEAFLMGDDDKVAQLDDALEKAFDARYEDMDHEIADLQKGNDALRSQLESLRRVQSSLPALHEQNANVKEGIDKLTKTASELRSAREGMHGRLDKERKTLNEREKELERINIALADVQKRLEAQELSAGDVERMAVKKQQLREQYASLRDNVASVEAKTEAEMSALKEALVQLQGLMQEYTAMATKLQLMPLGAKYSFGVDFSIRLNESYLDSIDSHNTDSSMITSSNITADFSTLAPTAAASASTTASLLGADLKHVIKPQLRELRAKMARQGNEHSKALLALGDTLTSYTEAKTDASKKVEQLSKKLRTTEENVSSLRGDVDATMATAEEETRQLTMLVAQTRNEVHTAQASLRELNPEVLHGHKLAMESQIKAMEATRKRLSDRIATALLQVTSHKEMVASKLAGLRTRFHTYRNDYLSKAPLTMPGPPQQQAVSVLGASQHQAASVLGASSSAGFRGVPSFAASVSAVPAATSEYSTRKAPPTPATTRNVFAILPGTEGRASLEAIGASSAVRAPGSVLSKFGTPNTSSMSVGSLNPYDETSNTAVKQMPAAAQPAVAQKLAFDTFGF